jgi:hypothetical protein
MCYAHRPHDIQSAGLVIFIIMIVFVFFHIDGRKFRKIFYEFKSNLNEF